MLGIWLTIKVYNGTGIFSGRQSDIKLVGMRKKSNMMLVGISEQSDLKLVGTSELSDMKIMGRGNTIVINVYVSCCVMK